MPSTVDYLLLGLTPPCTKEQVQIAFHKLAHIHHPDKQSGNADTFKKIAAARDRIIKNLEKTPSSNEWGYKVHNSWSNNHTNRSNAHERIRNMEINIGLERRKLDLEIEILRTKGMQRIQKLVDELAAIKRENNDSNDGSFYYSAGTA